MGAIDKLLKKWGFVKLGRYGLVLTPEDRILATRPAVLDDGGGGRIVGWQANDLASSELETWTPGTLRQRREVVPPAPLVRALQRPAPPPAPAPKPAKSLQTGWPVAVVPPAVAPQPPVEEDEWEWEIAVARARAEAADSAAEAEEDDSWSVPTPVHSSIPTASRSTVIPVPSLPRVSDPGLVRNSISGVRPYSPPPRRFPRATAHPPERRATLPPAASTIGLPSQRRVAAKTR